MDANKDPSSLNCSEDAFIAITDVSTKNEGYCESESCVLDDSDYLVLRRLCENSSNCLVYGSNFSSACLLERRLFNLSYLCKGKSVFQFMKFLLPIKHFHQFGIV